MKFYDNDDTEKMPWLFNSTLREISYKIIFNNETDNLDNPNSIIGHLYNEKLS